MFPSFVPLGFIFTPVLPDSRKSIPGTLVRNNSGVSGLYILTPTRWMDMKTNEDTSSGAT